MHLKTFHSPSIQDAIREARQKLGPDAMLLNSRRVSNANDSTAIFAVTFATTSPVDEANSEAPDGCVSDPHSTKQCRSGEASIADSATASGAQTEPRQEAAEESTKAKATTGKKEGDNAHLSKTTADGKEGETRRSSTRKPSASSSKTRPTRTKKTTTGRNSSRTQPERNTSPLEVNASQTSDDSRTVKTSSETIDLEPYRERLEQPFPSYEKLFAQMTSMRREMLQLAGSVRRASAASYRQELASEELKWAYDVLVSQDFSSELIEDVMEDITLRLGPETEKLVRAKKDRRRGKPQGDTTPYTEEGLLSLLRDCLCSRIDLRSEAGVHQRGGKPQILVLVGPPGVGKTTTLVKLAARFGLHTRFPLQIISMDNYRVAAAEQLRTYASVLGVGFDALPSAASLDKALQQYQSKELILIDTPGYGWKDFPAAEDLAALLRGQEQASVHLTLSASMKPADLSRVADLYEVFGYHSMLFTKLDETSTIGCLVSEAWTRRKPLSYICAGQRIPDDIEVASHERILQRMLPLSLNSEEFAA